MTDLNRRGWGLGVVLGAIALGGGAWLRASRTGGVLGPGTAAEAATPGSAGPLPQPLKTLDGRTLGNADIAGRAVVLNFWAPWCPPCVREMPELDRFSKSPAGKHTLVIGLAIDEQANVDKFLAAHPVGFPISVLGYDGLGWVRRLGNESGALPFSAVFDPTGKLVQRKAGSTTEAELSGWARSF